MSISGDEDWSEVAGRPDCLTHHTWKFILKNEHLRIILEYVFYMIKAIVVHSFIILVIWKFCIYTEFPLNSDILHSD